MDALAAAWLAGFFDGEGCVSGVRSGRGQDILLVLQIVQKERAVLDRITELHGGGKVARFSNGIHIWKLHGRHCLPFIEAILPYSIVKREKLKIARELALTIGASSRVSPETRALRASLANRLRVRGEVFVAHPRPGVS